MANPCCQRIAYLRAGALVQPKNGKWNLRAPREAQRRVRDLAAITRPGPPSGNDLDGAVFYLFGIYYGGFDVALGEQCGSIGAQRCRRRERGRVDWASQNGGAVF